MFSTSESGVIAIETEFINLVKSIFINKNNLMKKIFNVDFMPTLMQYDPLSKYIEIINNNIILSSFGVFPLIRYDTKDSGGIILKNDLIRILNLDNKSIPINTMNLPIIYIRGRSDVALTLYAVNIYIDNLKQITYSVELLAFITGRFQAYIEHDNKQNQKFFIKLESNRNIEINNQKEKYIKQYIIDKLRKLNSEYNKLYESLGSKVAPVIKIEKYGTDKTFSHDKPKYKKIV